MKRRFTTLDRYVFWLVLGRVSFCFLSVIVLYFLFEIAQRSKHFLRYMRRADSPGWQHDLMDLLDLSLSRLLPGLLEFAALGTLLGVILAVSYLLNKNEFVAVNAAGISRRRFFAPAFLVALLVSLGSMALTQFVVPDLMRRGRDLQLRILRRTGKFDSALSIQGSEPDGGPQAVVSVGRFDPATGRAEQFHALRLYPDGRREHLKASFARWQGGAWVFDPPGRTYDYRKKTVGQLVVRMETSLSPTLLFYEALGPDALTAGELWRSTHRSELSVELHTRLAVPLVALAALGLALPFLVSDLFANRWIAGLKAVGAALGFVTVTLALSQLAGAVFWTEIAPYLPEAGAALVGGLLGAVALWLFRTGRIKRGAAFVALAGACAALYRVGWWPPADFWPAFALVWLPDIGFLALGFHLVYKRMDG